MSALNSMQVGVLKRIVDEHGYAPVARALSELCARERAVEVDEKHYFAVQGSLLNQVARDLDAVDQRLLCGGEVVEVKVRELLEMDDSAFDSFMVRVYDEEGR